MNDSYIEDKEVLYRAILKIMPEAIEDGKPKASIFMDSRGASVDREGGRTRENVIETLRNRFNRNGKEDKYRGVVTITAKQCRDAQTLPVPCKTKNNEFHAEIHESESEKMISLVKAMKLSQQCKLYIEKK